MKIPNAQGPLDAFGPKLPEAPPQNETLAQALADVSNSDDPQTRHRLFAAVAESTLLVPVAADAPGGRRVIPTLQDEQGALLLPAFTDEAALLRWAPSGSRWAAIPAPELFSIASSGGFEGLAINPAGPHSARVGLSSP